MKRLSAILARGTMIVALGAMTTGLAACGGHSDDSAGKAPASASTSAPARASATAAAPSSAETGSSAAATTAPADSTPGTASQTTCATFKKMSIEDETALVKKVLAENPGSRLQGSPDVALGTAKLVCLASTEQNKPVAVALGVAGQ